MGYIFSQYYLNTPDFLLLELNFSPMGFKSLCVVKNWFTTFYKTRPIDSLR